MSGMALLVPVLTPENRDAVLERATHKSKRQIEQLVAELAPRPDVPSVMRKLPGPRPAPPPGAADGGDQGFGRTPELVPGTVGARDMALQCRSGRTRARSKWIAHPRAVNSSREPVPSRRPLNSSREQLAPRRSTASRRAVVEPLSPGRYKVQFTASAELHDQLERLAALMRSEVPDGDIAAIIQRAVAEKLERLEARRFAKTATPRKATPRKAVSHGDSSRPSRHIPAAVRRAVRARDGRPLPLRRRAGPTLLRAARARVPSPTPLRHGRRSQPREHQPAVPSPQPLPRRARLRAGGDQGAPDLARGNIPGSRERMTASPRPARVEAPPFHRCWSLPNAGMDGLKEGCHDVPLRWSGLESKRSAKSDNRPNETESRAPLTRRNAC